MEPSPREDLPPPEALAFLLSTDLLGGLPTRVIAPHVAAMRRLRIAAGGCIFEQGAPGDAAFFVVHGRVLLRSGEVTLLECRRGECFGEFALVDEGPRSAGAMALTDVELLRWERGAFLASLERTPQLARAVLGLLTAKLREEVDTRASLAAERERLGRDLALAREIQAGMLPEPAADLGGFAFAGHCRPAAEVGGDYYDFLAFDDGSVGMVIADVTGHGFYAGLFVAMAKSALHAQARHDPSPAAVMSALRRSLSLSPASGLLMSCCYLRGHAGEGWLEYSNAGHPGVLHWRAATDEVSVLAATDPILGVLDEDVPAHTERTRIAAGDLLVLFSDGLVETRGSGGMYGEQRLLEEVVGLAPGHPEPDVLVGEILEAVSDHSEGAPHVDDLSLLVARVRGDGGARS